MNAPSPNKSVARRVIFESPQGAASTSELGEIVLEVVGRVANKWTMSVLEVLNQYRKQRFTQVARLVGGISQRMLAKTIRQMQLDGFVVRTVHAEVPPKVEYELTELGTSLCAAFCGVWTWAEKHHATIEAIRKKRPTRR